VKSRKWRDARAEADTGQIEHRESKMQTLPHVINSAPVQVRSSGAP
jgi:hypothetical protein